MVPRFLVSVRNAREARSAVAGGADLIDVKEPDRGSLGFAGFNVLREVAGELCLLKNRAVTLSCALGELTDWSDDPPATRLPQELSFVKLGLAGAAGIADWEDRWHHILACVTRDVVDDRAVNRVAVVYADWQAAQAPRPEVVIKSAAKHDFSAVLFDTSGKSGQSLLDALPARTLEPLFGKVRDYGMRVAAAGSLTLEILPHVTALQPDIVAVRGAVCRDGQRRAEITELAVRTFRQRLAACCEPKQVSSNW